MSRFYELLVIGVITGLGLSFGAAGGLLAEETDAAASVTEDPSRVGLDSAVLEPPVQGQSPAQGQSAAPEPGPVLGTGVLPPDFSKPTLPGAVSDKGPAEEGLEEKNRERERMERILGVYRELERSEVSSGERERVETFREKAEVDRLQKETVGPAGVADSESKVERPASQNEQTEPKPEKEQKQDPEYYRPADGDPKPNWDPDTNMRPYPGSS